MALVKTARLNLAKQAAGDAPGTWGDLTNTGFDDADDRLFQTGAGTPVGSITADYIYQRYFDTTNGQWHTATDTSGPSTWIPESGNPPNITLAASITIPAAGQTLSTVIASTQPGSVHIFIKCISTELGFSVDDRIPFACVEGLNMIFRGAALIRETEETNGVQVYKTTGTKDLTPIDESKWVIELQLFGLVLV